MELQKLNREVTNPDDLWFYGPDCRWLFSKHKELIRLYLFEGYSPQKLDSEIFHINGKCSSGWYSASYISKYLGIKSGLRDQLKDFTIEDAIIELKSQNDSDYEELIQLLKEILLEDKIVDYFLNNVFIGKDEYETKEKYDILKNLIEKEKNLIIQGPPGVGKNYVAKNLVDCIVGQRDSDFVKIVQFHENYSYDYFVESPNQEKKGIFYNFCMKANENPNNPFFFIIDEIDKGNISKIFGELFSLLNNDKRGEEYQIPLLYSQKPFFIPENVYIIGLLNTSNKSNKINDYAFRRKFSFFDLEPGFSSKNFKEYMNLDVFNGTHFKKVIKKIQELNKHIENDDSLGLGFCIGHSYFYNLEHNGDINQELKYIIQFKILPLLKEYWFGEPEKVRYWETELYGSLGIRI